MKQDKRNFVTIETINKGTSNEFERVFIRCHMGHDLYSLSLDNLRKYPAQFEECTHYAHGKDN